MRLRSDQSPPDLIAQIDDTAHALLQRIRGGGINSAEQSAILTEQVKAFDVVAKWAVARKELLPKEEPKAAKFASMKGEFHGGNSAARNRGGPGKASGKDSAFPDDASPNADGSRAGNSDDD
jgi:hypothetical protein